LLLDVNSAWHDFLQRNYWVRKITPVTRHWFQKKRSFTVSN
jgi:hypothetical protein